MSAGWPSEARKRLIDVAVVQTAALNADPAFEHIIVQINLGGVHLLAEVTRDAIARLDLVGGKQLYALIKSVSINVIPEFRTPVS